MNAVDGALANKVDRNALVRALNLHEKAAQDIRSRLGFVVRETYQNVDPADAAVDGLTRMRTDQLDRLYEAGKINMEQRAAAQKIRIVWESMGRGLFPGASAVGGMVGTKSRGSFRHPLERMSEREFFIWIKEYVPWANGQAAKTAVHHSDTGFKISFARVCYHVVVDNLGPSQLERAWPVAKGHGAVVSLLRQGLSSWKHLEFDDEAGELEEHRQALLAQARARLTAVHPRASS